MEKVYDTCKGIVDRNGDADELIVAEFEAGQTEPTLIPLMVYYAVMLHRRETALPQLLGKLQSFMDYDLTRKACMDFVTAQRLQDGCDVDDLASVVNTVGQLTSDQLQCLGF